MISHSQSLGWTKSKILDELKSNYDVKSYQLKRTDDGQQDYISVTYKSSENLAAYYFQDGIVTQINWVMDKESIDLAKKTFDSDNRNNKKSFNSWEALSNGVKFYVKTFRVNTVYLITVSYYPIKDYPVSEGMSAVPY
jgi:hypothetical protein